MQISSNIIHLMSVKSLSLAPCNCKRLKKHKVFTKLISDYIIILNYIITLYYSITILLYYIIIRDKSNCFIKIFLKIPWKHINKFKHHNKSWIISLFYDFLRLIKYFHLFAIKPFLFLSQFFWELIVFLLQRTQFFFVLQLWV